MGSDESDGDKHQDEQDKLYQQNQKMKLIDSYFHSQPNENVDFKNGTIKHSWPFRKHYQKGKKTIKRNWIHQTPVMIRQRKFN